MRRFELPGETWVGGLVAGRHLVTASLVEVVGRTNLIETREPLHRYLVTTLGGMDHERMLAFFLDGEGLVLAEQIMAEGAAGEVTLPIRLVVGRALAFGAHAVVLAHNHPSGHAEPSRADIVATKRLKRAMRDLQLDLADHLIVGRGRVVSMRERGKI